LTPTSRDIRTLARLVSALAKAEEVAALSRPWRGVGEHLLGLTQEARQIALDGFLCHSGIDRASVIQAIDDFDPSGPASEDDPVISYATLADYARISSEQRWLWEGWIARGVLNVIAAEPGTGKTRFALDLARRLWFGLSWPDGQPNPWPPGTRTLWIQADRAFPEMLEAARAFGLPDEAIALGSSPDDPMGSLDLDDPETLAALSERIQAAGPVVVIIDTVMMTTSKNLCRPEDARAFFAPIMELAASSVVAFLALTHLSKDKEALGRRIVEKARVVIKMTKPDPEGQPHRRRFWVDKTAALNPPPLGVTMSDKGNDYDFTPPTEPDPNKGGRTPDKREKAVEFIRSKLAERDGRIWTELEVEWEAGGQSGKTFRRAVKDMEAAGELSTEGGPGTRKQKTLHQAGGDPETSPDFRTEPPHPMK